MTKLCFSLFLSFLLLATLSGCNKKVEVPDATGAGRSMNDIQPKEPLPTTGEMASADIYEKLAGQLQPIFFDYDKYDLRDDQLSALQSNARILREYPEARLIIEGHCDERGTEEYNMALGERRAEMVRTYLADSGIPSDRLNVTSYGESKPFAFGHGEESWKQNRRAQSVPVKN